MPRFQNETDLSSNSSFSLSEFQYLRLQSENNNNTLLVALLCGLEIMYVKNSIEYMYSMSLGNFIIGQVHVGEAEDCARTE